MLIVTWLVALALYFTLSCCCAITAARFMRRGDGWRSDDAPRATRGRMIEDHLVVDRARPEIAHTH